MTYIEALTEYDGPDPSLFLAGGITGTFDWQADLIARLADLPLVILNPRRKNFPINDPSAAPTQIEWVVTSAVRPRSSSGFHLRHFAPSHSTNSAAALSCASNHCSSALILTISGGSMSKFS